LNTLAFGVLKLQPIDKERLLQQYFPGAVSFRDLSNPEADLIIDALKLLAGQTPTRPQPRMRGRARGAVATGDVAMLITPAQRERLAELTRALLAAGLSSNYLEGVRLRACGYPFPRTSHEAEKAIEALKALEARVQGGWRPSSGESA
jgi:hypothetical protein